MKKKKRKEKFNNLAAISSLVLLIATFLLLRTDPETSPPAQSWVKETPKAEEMKTPTPESHSNVPTGVSNRTLAMKGRSIPPTVEAFKRDRGTNPLLQYTRFPLPGSDLEWVPQIRGVYELEGGEKLITKIGGISYIESDRGPVTTRVIFSPKEKQFGVWTGELVVRSTPEALAQLLTKFDLRLQEAESSENNESELRFLKAGDNFSLSKDLALMKQVTGVQEISLDVQFSRRSN